LSLAARSAPAAISSSTTCAWPSSAAHMSAVNLPHRTLPHARRAVVACSARPYPSSSLAARSAPAAMSSSTTCAWPSCAAHMSTVLPILATCTS
jgi:hypothetical protein